MIRFAPMAPRPPQGFLRIRAKENPRVLPPDESESTKKPEVTKPEQRFDPHKEFAKLMLAGIIMALFIIVMTLLFAPRQ